MCIHRVSSRRIFSCNHICCRAQTARFIAICTPTPVGDGNSEIFDTEIESSGCRMTALWQRTPRGRSNSRGGAEAWFSLWFYLFTTEFQRGIFLNFLISYILNEIIFFWEKPSIAYKCHGRMWSMYHETNALYIISHILRFKWTYVLYLICYHL